VHNEGGDGADRFVVKILTDAAKLTDMRVARYIHAYHLTIFDRISCRLSGRISRTSRAHGLRHTRPTVVATKSKQ